MSLVLVNSVLSSCSSDVEYVKSEPSVKAEELVSSSDLLHHLSTYNDSMFQSRPKTRGREKFLQVALADVVGAYAGGKVGARVGTWVGSSLGSPVQGCVFGAALGAIGWGGWKSYKAYHRNSSCSYSIVVTNTFKLIEKPCFRTSAQLEDHNLEGNDTIGVFIDSQSLNGYNLTEEEKNVGQAHNIILALAIKNKKLGDLRKRIDSLKEETSPKQIIDKADSVLLSEKMRDMCMSSEFIENCNAMTDSIENGKFCANDKANYVVKLFNDVFELSRDDSDVKNLVNQYKTIISQSNELSEEEKSWISKALATAVFSYNYWEKNNTNK